MFTPCPSINKNFDKEYHQTYISSENNWNCKSVQYWYAQYVCKYISQHGINLHTVLLHIQIQYLLIRDFTLSKHKHVTAEDIHLIAYKIHAMLQCYITLHYMTWCKNYNNFKRPVEILYTLMDTKKPRKWSPYIFMSFKSMLEITTKMTWFFKNLSTEYI